jgi:triosephosphate isomerase
MYKTVDQSLAYAKELIRLGEESGWPDPELEWVICPTLPALPGLFQRLKDTPVGVGAQNVDLGVEGARTGAVSAMLVKAAGADYAIVGHSERRRYFGETDAVIAQKVAQALAAGLVPIVCVGEEEAERNQGRTLEVIARQLEPVWEGLTAEQVATLVVAYEPVWAIGSGRVATADDAERVAQAIRTEAQNRFGLSAQALRVLYGGSVSASNLGAFWQCQAIDGALVGGASLSVNEFYHMAHQWRRDERE